VIALHYNFERYPCSVRYVVITVFVVYGWLPHVHFAFYVGLGSQIGSTSRKKRSLNFEEDQIVDPFIADHPFMWLLRDNDSGMWIFLGRYVDPILIRAIPEITSTHHNDEL
jgi:hypothetical protein